MHLNFIFLAFFGKQLSCYMEVCLWEDVSVRETFWYGTWAIRHGNTYDRDREGWKDLYSEFELSERASDCEIWIFPFGLGKACNDSNCVYIF